MTAKLLLALLLAGLSCQPVKRNLDPPRPQLTPERVRVLASSPEHLDHLWLVEYGAAAFPIYLAILTNTESDPEVVAGVISVLSEVDAPKGQFRELVIPYLSHKDDNVRYTSMFLMKQIGTREEASILIALLSDKHGLVRYEAAEALAVIGSQRELTAMDAWLMAATARRENKYHLEHVKKCRDLLDKRLKEAAKPKDARSNPFSH